MPSPPLLTPKIGIDGVEVRVTTRLGGVSRPPYDTLNLAIMLEIARTMCGRIGVGSGGRSRGIR